MNFKSPYILAQTFAAMRSLTRDFSLHGQNKLSPDVYNEKLTNLIDQLEATLTPPSPYASDSNSERPENNLLEDCENYIAQSPSTYEQKDGNVWPIFHVGSKRRASAAFEDEHQCNRDPVPDADAQISAAENVTTSPAQDEQSCYRENQEPRTPMPEAHPWMD